MFWLAMFCPAVFVAIVYPELLVVDLLFFETMTHSDLSRVDIDSSTAVLLSKALTSVKGLIPLRMNEDTTATA
eukprot:scaffold3197_cov153-Skeletonema_menzelii.AAC.3